MCNRRLKTIFIALVTAVTLACIVPSGVYRLATVFNMSSLTQFNDYRFHSTTLESLKQSNRTNNNYPILIFNPPSWVPVHSYQENLTKRCVYNNCTLTTDRANLKTSSAIIYYLTAAPALPQMPPIKPLDRNPDQIWVFAWLEPPIHHISSGSIYQNEAWRNSLNWTMTYTHGADVLYPYGTLRRQPPPAKNYSSIFHRKTKMAAWIVSNCKTYSKREYYVKKMQRYGINVDVFGGCAEGRRNSVSMRKEIDKNYKFYLSFENNLCKDYITEKFFKYFNYDVILVVRGGGNYSILLPNDSYINTADFGSVKDLAKYLLFVASNEERYTYYLTNKDNFKSIYRGIRNESFCKLCEKLNNLEQNRRTYADLLDRIHNGTCFKPRDIS